MEELTKQDLMYAEHALRVSAGVSEGMANDPNVGSTGKIYADAATDQRELAEKFKRVYQRMR